MFSGETVGSSPGHGPAGPDSAHHRGAVVGRIRSTSSTRADQAGEESFGPIAGRVGRRAPPGQHPTVPVDQARRPAWCRRCRWPGLRRPGARHRRRRYRTVRAAPRSLSGRAWTHGPSTLERSHRVTTQETAPPPATFADLFGTITATVERAIQGKADVVELAVLCLVSEGHLLLEDVPGVGKTSLAKALAASIDCEFGRIQFTPDLLPSDVVGVTVWNRSAAAFEFRPGPVFASIVLGRRDQPGLAQDPVGPARGHGRGPGHRRRSQLSTRSAVHGHRHPEPDRARGHLPAPREPARPLPDAGLGGLPGTVGGARGARDPRRRRPPRSPHRRGIRRRHPGPHRRRPHGARRPAPSGATSSTWPTPPATTRISPWACRRAPPCRLQRVARARAAAQGRAFVVPDDVKALAEPVLAHRLLVTPEAQVQGIEPVDAVREVLGADRRAHGGRTACDGADPPGVVRRRAGGRPCSSPVGCSAWSRATSCGSAVGSCWWCRCSGWWSPASTCTSSRTLAPPRVHAGRRAGSISRSTNRARRRSPVLRRARPRVGHPAGPPCWCRPSLPGASARAAYRFAHRTPGRGRRRPSAGRAGRPVRAGPAGPCPPPVAPS